MFSLLSLKYPLCGLFYTTVSILGLPKETCLIPNEENQSPSTGENYNFITECFFLTHQCIHMSFHTVHEKFLKLNQELHRVQRLYNEVRGQGNDEVEPVRSIKRQMEKGNLYTGVGKIENIFIGYLTIGTQFLHVSFFE